MSKTKTYFSMKNINWTSKEKLTIVLEGLKEKVPLGELCVRHGINQTQYYRWRDKLFEDGDKVFEHGGISKTEERLKNENKRLKGMIGELTLELKKTIIEKKRVQEKRDEKQTNNRSNNGYKIRPSLLGLQANLGIHKIQKRYRSQQEADIRFNEKA